MKKWIVSVLTTVMMLAITSVSSFCSTREVAINRRFTTYFNELRYELGTSYSELEDNVRNNIEYDLGYENLGYGMYQIKVVFIAYEEEIFEYTYYYDSVEEETTQGFWILDGERVSDDVIDDLYPEFDF